MPAPSLKIPGPTARVYLRHPRARDVTEFVRAVRASQSTHGSWVRAPATATAFAALLKRSRGADFECLLACRREDDVIIGVFDLLQIFRGVMQSAYLGYYALAPHVRQGYMNEGLALALEFAFRQLKLHRVEANIQPDNSRSIALVRQAGFMREGYSRRYLKIAGRWRDHERWALLVEDWRAHRRGSR